MFSYSQIVKDAYRITIRNKVLWLFGLFAVGGFNINFADVGGWGRAVTGHKLKFFELLGYFLAHPAFLALASASVLIISLAGLVITNWSRIMLILSVQDIITKNGWDNDQRLRKSRAVLFPVIRMSLLTSSLIVVVAAGFLLPPILWVQDAGVREFLLILGALIFMVFAYTISYVNIFSTLFIILFKKGVGKGLDLGTDFFISRWSQILGLSLVLVVIYAAAFLGGLGIIYVVRVFLYFLGSFAVRFGIFEFSAIILVTRLVYGLLVWFWVAGLSVFFNTAWLLFFLKTVTPIKTEEAEKFKPITAPASAV